MALAFCLIARIGSATIDANRFVCALPSADDSRAPLTERRAPTAHRHGEAVDPTECCRLLKPEAALHLATIIVSAPSSREILHHCQPERLEPASQSPCPFILTSPKKISLIWGSPAQDPSGADPTRFSYFMNLAWPLAELLSVNGGGARHNSAAAI